MFNQPAVSPGIRLNERASASAIAVATTASFPFESGSTHDSFARCSSACLAAVAQLLGIGLTSKRRSRIACQNSRGFWRPDNPKKWDEINHKYAKGKTMRNKLYRPETSISTPSPEFEPVVRKPFPRMYNSLAEFADQYDAFTLDQFGVLSNVHSAFPGVVECLTQLRTLGKSTVILSNCAGRVGFQRNKLEKIMGIDSKLVSGIVTSGELTHAYLRQNREKLGSRVLWIASEDLEARGLADFFHDLEGFTLAESVKDADFILVSGVGSIFAGTPCAISTTFEEDAITKPFEKYFRLACHHSLPMLCANPDEELFAKTTAKRSTIEKQGAGASMRTQHMRDKNGRAKNSTKYMPGLLARRYMEIGGRVIFFGKPYTAAFEAARRLLEEQGFGDGRICHVGDSLNHDVVGADHAGFDAAWVVQTGVDKTHLKKDACAGDVHTLCRNLQLPSPAVVVPRFEW